MSTKLHTVHVRVNDAATAQPTPCRVRFTDADGKYYAPFGRLTEFATDMGVDVGGNVLLCGEAYAYIDGSCEINLPAGPIKVAISKGPEYKPITTEPLLSPAKLALRFELERWSELRSQGWYSGDTRAHFICPHAAVLEAAAEDVAVVNILAWQCPVWGDHSRQWPAISNMLAFSGQRPALEIPGHMVVVNTMNLHDTLGRLLLLNCHRPVHPLTFGGPDGLDNWTMADWCDQCHRKSGLVIGDNFFGNFPGYHHGELLADLILGKVDALQLDGFENPDADATFEQESEWKEWYSLLDCGFRVPLVGGSDKDCNLTCVGSTRTYAKLGPGENLTYKNWIEAVRSGRTFVTNGPLLLLTVNGHDPGSALELAAGEQIVHVHLEARSWAPLLAVEVLVNNVVVARATPSGSPAAAQIEMSVPIPRSGWLLARCWGEYDENKEDWIAAQSSPVYLHIEGKPPCPDAQSTAMFVGYLDTMLDWVAKNARCETEQQRERLANIFRSARQELLKRAAS